MISIKITKSILEKHRQYIIQSEIKNKFENLKFNKDILEILPDKGYNIEHEKFCDYIIVEVEKLENNSCDALELSSNIFLADCLELHNINKVFEKDFPLLFHFFKLDNKNSNVYKDKILEEIGYEKFSSKELKQFFFIENKMYKKYSKNYIKNRLKEIKPKGKKIYSKYEFGIFCNELLRDIKSIEELNKKSKTVDPNLRIIKREIEGHIDNGFNLDEFVNSTAESLKKWNENYKNGYISINNYKEYLNRCGEETIQWSAYNFVFELGIKVCPYCNRQYISPIYSSNGKLRADLDHFYAKSKYPYLSMSIQNLLPCCKFCNSSLKGDKEFTFENNINPYDKDIDKYMYFSYYPKTAKTFYGQDEVIIKLNDRKDADQEIIKKFRNNVKTFQIEELYQYNTDIVKLMLKKRMIFSDKYLDNFYNIYSNIFKDKEEMIRILFNNTIDENMDNPFSKLKKDIIAQLIYKK